MQPDDRTPFDLTLLDRYLAGECSPDESAKVSDWLIQHPDATLWLGGVVHGLSSGAALDNSVSHDATLAQRTDHSWQALQAKLSGPAIPTPVSSTKSATTKPTALRKSSLSHTPRAVWYAVAGVVAGAILMLTVDHHVLDQWTTRTSGAMTEYVTQQGQRARITLPDGSTVMLNVASRIDVPVGFGTRNRTIHLTGQAYFQVAHANNAPFIVDAAGVRTQVLGTEFGVRAYQPGDVRVAVQSGRVAVQGVVLTSNDVARISSMSRSTVIVAHHQRLDVELSFITGQLVLTNIPLRDALDDLGRWYGATIRLGDPALGNMLIDATLVSGSIGDLMEVLQTTFNVRVVRSGRTLTVYPNPRPHTRAE